MGTVCDPVCGPVIVRWEMAKSNAEIFRLSSESQTADRRLGQFRRHFHVDSYQMDRPEQEAGDCEIRAPGPAASEAYQESFSIRFEPKLQLRRFETLCFSNCRLRSRDRSTHATFAFER